MGQIMMLRYRSGGEKVGLRQAYRRFQPHFTPIHLRNKSTPTQSTRRHKRSICLAVGQTMSFPPSYIAIAHVLHRCTGRLVSDWLIL